MSKNGKASKAVETIKKHTNVKGASRKVDQILEEVVEAPRRAGREGRN